MKFRHLTARNFFSAVSSFTLTEVLVGMLVLCTVIVSLYAGVSSGFAFVKLAREDLRATQIMLQRMEAVRLYTSSQFTNASYFSTNTFVAYYAPAGQAAGSGGATYTVTTAITTDTPAASYSSNMRRITVRVSWLSGKVSRKREMSTFVARYGMQNYIFKE